MSSNSGTMRAAWYERQGPAREVLRVGDLPVPVPGAGEVRVRVHVSAVNPSDTKSRTGWSGPMPFPRVIPHQDGAGTIDAVGEGVDPARVGQRAWVYQAQFGRPFGTAADYVVVPQERAVPLPDGTSFAVGATLGIPALTAHRCLFADGPIDGLTVLVTGGAGAVGLRAIQWAVYRGAARVIATVRRAEQERVARDAGAHHVIVAPDDALRERVRAITGGDRSVDRLVDVDLPAHAALLPDLLAVDGVASGYSAAQRDARIDVPFLPLMRAGNVIRTVLVYVMPEPAKQAAVRDVTAALQDGALDPVVQRVYTLAEIAAAHEAQDDHPLGKLLISLA